MAPALAFDGICLMIPTAHFVEATWACQKEGKYFNHSDFYCYAAVTNSHLIIDRGVIDFLVKMGHRKFLVFLNPIVAEKVLFNLV